MSLRISLFPFFVFSLLVGCREQNADIFHDALLDNLRLSECDNRKFEHYATYFLSDAPMTDGHVCILSQLADLAYGGKFATGPVCDEQGNDLFHFAERESESDEFLNEAEQVLERRKGILDNCYNRLLEEHPDAGYSWTLLHKQYLSEAMLDTIFRHVVARRNHSDGLARHVLLDLFGVVDSSESTFSDLDSKATNAIPFVAMYDFWRTNKEYVLSYRLDPFMIVETEDEAEPFKNKKMTSPIQLIERARK